MYMTLTANNRVERTAAMRFGFDGDGLQTTIIAVASAPPVTVAHPCRNQDGKYSGRGRNLGRRIAEKLTPLLRGWSHYLKTIELSDKKGVLPPMSKYERTLSRVLALMAILQLLALVPSIPYIYYAACYGLSAILRGEFGYGPVRDSVIASLGFLLLVVSCTYPVIALGLVSSRRIRLSLWASSSMIYLLHPVAYVLDPRPAQVPPVIGYVLISYLILMSLLSASAFYFSLVNVRQNVA